MYLSFSIIILNKSWQSIALPPLKFDPLMFDSMIMAVLRIRVNLSGSYFREKPDPTFLLKTTDSYSTFEKNRIRIQRSEITLILPNIDLIKKP